MPTLIAGAINCRKIPIMSPTKDPESFYNRKKLYSIKLQDNS
jgi:hypothetical protein